MFDLRPRKTTVRFANSHFCRTHIMNIMGRHVLRLMEIGAVAIGIAIPQLASAFDSENGAAFKLGRWDQQAPR